MKQPLPFSRHPIADTSLPALRMVPPSWRAFRAAQFVVLAFVMGASLLTFAPWFQNVGGSGRVVAFTPLERQQGVEAPVKGRISRWWVQEGDHVKAGEPLVEIVDNDPQYFERLEAEREAVVEQRVVQEAQIKSLTELVASVEEARDNKVTSLKAKVRAAERKLAESRQKLRAKDAKLETQLLNLARQKTLFEQGLTSERKLELAQLYEAQARTDRDGARQAVEARRELVGAARAELSSARAEGDGKVEKARADVNKAQAERSKLQAKLLSVDTKLARQASQRVLAPRDGTVFRMLAAVGAGAQVKAGDKLLILVPDGRDRAVEIWVDGNDAALISPGRRVRLQFEGWPAVQFTGWPSAAVGTFGGEVAFIDAADDGKGNFRLVVRPDPADEPWPDPRFLRQGARANGWVMLDRVTLGYEVWRQLNGFPPAVNPPGTTAPIYSGGKDGKGGDLDDGKGTFKEPKPPVKLKSK